MSPDGSDTDPQTGSFGAAGAGYLIGALVGTFSANPTSANQIFTLGTSLTFRPMMDETLYAIINDNYYPNNDSLSGYSVSLSVVPLPSTLPSLGLAIAVLGAAGTLRRHKHRRRHSVGIKAIEAVIPRLPVSS